MEINKEIEVFDLKKVDDGQDDEVFERVTQNDEEEEEKTKGYNEKLNIEDALLGLRISMETNNIKDDLNSLISKALFLKDKWRNETKKPIPSYVG